jgi:hypothetical protein
MMCRLSTFLYTCWTYAVYSLCRQEGGHAIHFLIRALV